MKIKKRKRKKSNVKFKSFLLRKSFATHANQIPEQNIMVALCRSIASVPVEIYNNNRSYAGLRAYSL